MGKPLFQSRPKGSAAPALPTSGQGWEPYAGPRPSV